MFLFKTARNLHLAPVNDVEMLPVPMLRELYLYWRSKKNGRMMPVRDDIKPGELVRLLSRIILIDVEPNSWRFRFRLIGTSVVSLMGADYTGAYLDEIAGKSSMLRRFRWLAEHRKAYYSFSKLDWIGRDFQKYHALGLPLADEPDKVNMILCGIEPFSAGSPAGGMASCG